MKEVYRVCDQYSCLVSQLLHEHMLEYLLLHVRIESGNRIVHQHDRLIGIHCPSKAHPRFLPTAQVDALFANLGPVTSGQDF